MEEYSDYKYYKGKFNNPYDIGTDEYFMYQIEIRHYYERHKDFIKHLCSTFDEEYN